MSRKGATEHAKEKLRCWNGLMSYRNLCASIDKTERRIEEIRESMYSVGSPRFDGMPRGGQSYDSRTERMAARVDELERKLRDKVGDEIDWYEWLEELLENLKPDEQAVLQLRYLDGASWEATATALYGESDDWANDNRQTKRAFKAHEKALINLEKIWPKDAPMPCEPEKEEGEEEP